MDVLSHFVLPFLLVFALTRSRPAAFAAGVGGSAPDLDSLTFPLAFLDPLYFLGHRGVSHSLVGAPFFAALAVLILRAPVWGKVFPFASELRFRWPLVLLALVASYTHLWLDWSTSWGVPLLFPFSLERLSLGLFFYSVVGMVPLSGYLVWRIVRDTATPRTYLRVGVALAVVLLISGGVRVATRPDADVALPGPLEWQWTALERSERGFEATFLSGGRVVGNASYHASMPTDAAGIEALAKARAHPEYRAFTLYSAGPEVVQVTGVAGGAWNVTFVDLHERTQADRSRWQPFGEDRGLLRLTVSADGRVEEIEDR